MRQHIGVAALCGLLIVAPASAQAASEWTKGHTYFGRANWKMTYGLDNLFFGWTSLFVTPYRTARASDNPAAGVAAAATVGLAKGLWNAVGQEIGGALTFVTFLVTPLDIPIPEGGVKILK